ncbi:MAG: hypothetical protein A2Y40_10655 [Candidatus Margulisbacteria bacterium GWF2_35_9]|nr:MAG: hypothetical protein A2Y40_10655 [Candidatus Margulisbacteria bacterium GWF2_35_9]
MRVKIIVIMLVANSVFSSVNFSDIPLNHWARPYVEEATALGVINGYEDNTFRGRKPLTRYDLAVIIAKYNRYVEDKYNLLLAGIGETVPTEPNYRTARTSNKVDFLEEFEDELWNLRNDFKIMEKKVNQASNKDKYSINFLLDSHVAIDYKRPDTLVSTGKLKFKKDVDNLNLGINLTAGDLNSDSNYTGIELFLSGFYTFPVLDTIYFGLVKGPGEVISSYGEVIPFAGDEFSLKAQAIPIEFKFQPVSTSSNVLGLTFKESYAISNLLVSVFWNKSYLYNTRMTDLIKANGMLDNKDILALNVNIMDYKLTSQWGIGVNNNASYLLQFTFSSYQDSIVSIKKYSSKPNAYQTTMGDSYSAMHAVNIYNEPIQNGSDYIGISVDNFMNIFYGAVDINRVSDTVAYKAKAGIKLKINDNLTVVKEGRYSKDAVNGRDIAALLYLNITL